MNPQMKQKLFSKLLLAALVAAAYGAPVLAQDAQAASQPAAQSGQRSDGQIEMDVVQALDASAALKQDLITAATIQGEVTLSGTVSNEASKELAESIVSHINGVAKVSNNLKIGNPQDAQDGAPAANMDTSAAETAPQPGDGQQQADSAGPAPQPGAAPYPSQTPDQAQNSAPAPGSDSGSQQAQAPPPPPGGYARPLYQPRRTPAYAEPTGPVTVPNATLLRLRTSEPVDSKNAKDGTPVQFTVIQDVAVGGVLAIPRGATVHGVVTESKKAGELSGSAVLALKLTSLDLGGQSYPLTTDQFKVKSPNKAGQTVGSALSGGVIGTIIGCAVGRGAGCAVGAGAGVAAGTAASAASSGPRAWIPAEALVDFHLTAPLTVNPVSRDEANRLAQGLFQGGPQLYRRPGPGYGYYGAYPYPYAYTPVYYRPYYVVGGYYYWR